jgi:aryl-alcohol dehydrogenase-like predicted oxidoreductase
MEYRTLTGTGATVSRLSLGTYFTFGGQLSEEDAMRLVHRALDAGVTFFDTADVYGQGAAETILGKALQGRRDGVVLASKVRGRIGPHAHKDVGLSRWHVIRGVEASLRRLGTDCLDICYFHAPDPNAPLEESLAAADLLVRQGKVLYLGLSNYAGWQVGQARYLAQRHGYARPVVTQVIYNLLNRAIESELLPFCQASGVGVAVYSPLSAGLLTGKHRPGAPPAGGTRFEMSQDYYQRYWREANFSAVAALTEIAQQAGLSLLSLALRWLAHQPVVDSIIIGASNLAQLQENLGAWEGPLDEATVQACDRVWQAIPNGAVFRYNR